jgi:hypothetical protein
VTTIQGTRQRSQSTRGGLMWLLYLGDAGLLVTSGLIHLHLWDIAYRHVKTLDVLFLVQVAACLLAALTLLVTRHVLVVLGAAALMAGTIVGFLLARTVVSSASGSRSPPRRPTRCSWSRRPRSCCCP